jgi:hypothetical protein
MISGTHEQAATNCREEYNEQIPDRRLWTAVLLQALEDWSSSNMRLRIAAEKFLFESGRDFATVCEGAGLEPGCVLHKLQTIKRISPARPVFQLPLVA